MVNDIIYGFILNLINSIGLGLIFVIILSAIFALFICALMLAIFKPLYSLKKRAWFFISSLALLCLQLTFSSLTNELWLFYLSVSAFWLLCLPVLLIPAKSVKTTNAQRSLAKYIDQQVRNPSLSNQIFTPQQKDIEPQIVKCQPLEEQEEQSKFELDFQHVKNVIKKLEYYPLCASDKKIIKDLDDAIYQAENQNFSPVVKAKINDGLGALLKIMSKHGV